MQWLWLPSTFWDHQYYAISWSGLFRTSTIEWKTASVSRRFTRLLLSTKLTYDCSSYLPTSWLMNLNAVSLTGSLSNMLIFDSFPIARSRVSKLVKPLQRGPKAPVLDLRWLSHCPNRCSDTAAKSLAVILLITLFEARRCCWYVEYCESIETFSSCLEWWF